MLRLCYCDYGSCSKHRFSQDITSGLYQHQCAMDGIVDVLDQLVVVGGQLPLSRAAWQCWYEQSNELFIDCRVLDMQQANKSCMQSAVALCKDNEGHLRADGRHASAGVIQHIQNLVPLGMGGARGVVIPV